jgi:diguanylate cyclase (GGDEF)-like protein
MKNEKATHLNRFSIAAIFLVLMLLAMGDVLEIIPFFAPIVANPFFPYFHETHDLLALLVILYVAHKFSPAMGWRAVGWFFILHVPYVYIIFGTRFHEVFRLIILIIVAVFEIEIITVRNRLVTDLETQRSAAFKRAEELTILNGIATIGVEATSVETLIEDAVRIIDSALHPDYFDIGLVDETTNAMRIYRSTRITNMDSLIIPLGKGIASQVVTSGKVRRVSDVSLEPAYLAVNPDVRSELCVPIKAGAHVIGFINIESKTLDAFNDADEQLMITFADQLVTAIEKVRLFQLEQRHAREAETLRQAGSIVAATLKQDEAIERILVQLERVVPYNSASVQLLRDGYLEIVGGRGWPDPSVVLGMRFPIPGDNPNTVVIQTRKPYVLGNAPSVHAAFREEPHSHIQSFLGVPLVVGDQIIGMLAVDSVRPNFFTSDHVRLATAFADQVALAIQNAKLFSEVQQLASIDSLTGLHNRRHFMELAKREFGRARRYQHPLAAIMMDIDHFKRINDTYGHALGDHVLATVAERCRNTVRDIDIVGRYGGEEFVSLLLETDLNGARIVAERLRQSAALPIETDSGKLSITISIGVAIMDKKCTGLDALLVRADQALYVAKLAGRNQVAVWQD